MLSWRLLLSMDSRLRGNDSGTANKKRGAGWTGRRVSHLKEVNLSRAKKALPRRRPPG
jgi:hypothetical protein